MKPKIYRVEIAWPTTALLLSISFAGLSFLIRDLRGLWLATLCGLAGFSQLTNVVMIDREGLSISIRFLPFLPAWHRTVKWTDVAEVRAVQNPFFVEGYTLAIRTKPHSGKQVTIHIPVVLYKKRDEMLREIFSLLPSQAIPVPSVIEWAGRVGRTPKWQLCVAFLVILFLVSIWWFTSFGPLR